MAENVPLFKFSKEVDLKDFTLIIPSVAVGNVAQLTVDLLITTYNLKKVATIWHLAIIPAAGSDPFIPTSKELSTACELYVNEEYKIAAVQLRSGLEFNRTIAFIKTLRQSLKSFCLKNVVILTSSHAYEMHNVQSNVFRYISNEDCELMKKLDIPVFETNADGKYLVHGSGFAVKMYEMLKDDLKCTVLIRYCYEGDNRPEAESLLKLVVEVVNLSTENLKNIVVPFSWQFVFGNPPPINIY